MAYHHSDNNLPGIERQVTEKEIFQEPNVVWPEREIGAWSETDQSPKWQHGFVYPGPVVKGEDAFKGESPYKGWGSSGPSPKLDVEKHLPAYHLPIIPVEVKPTSEQEIFGGPNLWD